MTEYLNQFLADRAAELVYESFTGVEARWWWERPMGGGIIIAQELDPEAMSREISERTNRDLAEVHKIVEEELGIEDPEPVVLTFEIPGETTADDASRMLADRSSTPEGLATGIYRRVQEAVKAG